MKLHLKDETLNVPALVVVKGIGLGIQDIQASDSDFWISAQMLEVTFTRRGRTFKQKEIFHHPHTDDSLKEFLERLGTRVLA
jgi:hypothetical protein